MPSELRESAVVHVQNEDDYLANGNSGNNSSNATRLGYLNPDVGFKNESVAANDTGSFSLLSLLKRLMNAYLSNISGAFSNNKVSSTLADPIPTGGNHIGQIGGTSKAVIQEFTRPDNGTAYSPGEVIGQDTASFLTFGLVGRENGGTGYISGAMLETTHKNFAGGTIVLYLYKEAPSAIADGNNLNLSRNDDFIGWIEFDANDIHVDGGAGSNVGYIEGSLPKEKWKQFTCASNSRNLYGHLATPDGFQSQTQAQYRIWLYVENN